MRVVSTIWISYNLFEYNCYNSTKHLCMKMSWRKTLLLSTSFMATPRCCTSHVRSISARDWLAKAGRYCACPASDRPLPPKPFGIFLERRFRTRGAGIHLLVPGGSNKSSLNTLVTLEMMPMGIGQTSLQLIYVNIAHIEVCFRNTFVYIYL